jgi:hypothetical protein
VLHIMAIVQLRHNTPGRAYYRRKLAAAKTSMEALRSQASTVVDRIEIVVGAFRITGPAGHPGEVHQAA